MITKTRKPSSFTFTASDGTTHESLEGVKLAELLALCNLSNTPADSPLLAMVKHPREAIAILRFGLPRKPRAVKPPMGRKPRRNLKREMPEIPGV